MYRRIQLIKQYRKEDCTISNLLASISGRSTCEGAAAWAELNTSRRQTDKTIKSCRFYLTEEGWAKFGREVVAACRKSGQQYRVLAVREREVEVLYWDGWQVMVRPRKRGSLPS